MAFATIDESGFSPRASHRTRPRSRPGSANRSEARTTALRVSSRYLKEAAEHDIPGFSITPVFRRDRYGRGGDHIPFNEQGYAAVRLTEPNEDFNRQHQKVEVVDGVALGDVIERVDFNYVSLVAKVNASLLANLALAPATPEARFGSARQGYDTKLTWPRGKEPDLAGYRVVWRATHQPFWERGLDVGDVTEATIKDLSKDDCFFAVQAIDKDGNASLPAFPVPPAPSR